MKIRKIKSSKLVDLSGLVLAAAGESPFRTSLLQSIPDRKSALLVRKILSGNKSIKDVDPYLHNILNSLYSTYHNISLDSETIAKTIKAQENQIDASTFLFKEAYRCVIAALCKDGSLGFILSPLAPFLKGYADPKVVKAVAQALKKGGKGHIKFPDKDQVKSSISDMAKKAEGFLKKEHPDEFPKEKQSTTDADAESFISAIKLKITSGSKRIPEKAVEYVMLKVRDIVYAELSKLKKLSSSGREYLLESIIDRAINSSRQSAGGLFRTDRANIDPQVVSLIDRSISVGVASGTQRLESKLSIIPGEVNSSNLASSAKRILEINFAQEYSEFVHKNAISVNENTLKAFTDSSFLALALVISKAVEKSSNDEAKKELENCFKTMNKLFPPWKKFSSLEKLSGSTLSRGHYIDPEQAGNLFRKIHGKGVQVIEEALNSPQAMTISNRQDWEKLLIGSTLAVPVQVSRIVGVDFTVGEYMHANLALKTISARAGKRANLDSMADQLLKMCTEWEKPGGGLPKVIDQDSLLEEPQEDTENDSPQETDASGFLNPGTVIMLSVLLNVLYDIFSGGN